MNDKELMHEWKEFLKSEILSCERIAISTKLQMQDYIKAQKYEKSEEAQAYYKQQLERENGSLEYFNKKRDKNKRKLEILNRINI